MPQRTTIIALSVVFAASVVPVLVLAQSQGGFVPLTDGDFTAVFGTPGSGNDPKDLGTFINSAFKMALSIGAILAVLRVAWAGYQYMSSDAWGEKSHAKEILGDVTIGLLLLLSVYLILYQINPNITSLQIKYVTPDATVSAPPSATVRGSQ